MLFLHRFKVCLMVLLALTSVVGFIIIPPQRMQKWPTLLFVQTIARETLKGNLEGKYSGTRNRINFTYGVEPGDIIMCHNPKGAYGFWTHCAIYVGHNQAIDSEDFTNGTRIVNAGKYEQYDQVAVYRGLVSERVRNEIVKSAMLEVGKPYDPFSPLSDSHSEYCSKLIWRVFKENGVSICRGKTWIVPDDLLSSSKMQMVYSWNA